MSANRVMWQPSASRRDAAAISQFISALRQRFPQLPPPDDPAAFRTLHRWSVEHPEQFWREVWRDSGVVGDLGSGPALLPGPAGLAPPARGGAQWFGTAQLNFAENLLRHTGQGIAIIGWDERGHRGTWTHDQLRDEVSRVSSGLRALGVQPGDRVAGWLPNIAEAVIAMLAAAAIGAVWTSCSPDFGVEGIVDRFGQTAPVVLIFADGYRYAGKVHDCMDRAQELLARLPSVRHAVRVHYLGHAATFAHAALHEWSELGRGLEDHGLQFTRLPFDHPLYILYSSGTTGLPKCLVHGAGGTLLQHLKEHRLHVDLRHGESVFYFTTLGWMMWNWLVSALACGAAIVLYDGAPMPPGEPDLLWRMADDSSVAVFGTSAKYLALAEKSAMAPRRGRKLEALRAVLSTGSPLAPESFDWIETAVGQVQVASISGGTDIVSCFVLGNPLEPVHRGEIQGPGLGMALEVFTADGLRAPDGVSGELVCSAPFPSMPIGFWNDHDDVRYHEAYFARYPGVWHHGDWAARTEHGGYVISGRSDATLNPGGVRIGTAEIYRQVEAIDEVVESLVIGQRTGQGATSDVRVVLFVRLRAGLQLDERLRDLIRRRIRSGASPHHVPRVIVQVHDLPRTRSGKLSELAVRDVVEGREVANVGALANPESLEEFRDRVELQDG